MPVCKECGSLHHTSWCSHSDLITGEPYLWMAYYSDWSCFLMFTDELDALRYAVGNGMKVSKIRTGVPIKDQVL